jgi:pyrroloquinoline quinone (PQQ) biosynthesis protein C
VALSQEEFRVELLGLLEDREQREGHPFYTLFFAGELGMEELRTYYRYLYHTCTNFVRLVSLAHALAEHRDARLMMATNFIDEYGHGEPGSDHPKLAMHVGLQLGLTEEEIENAPSPEGIPEQWARMRAVASKSFVSALAVMLVIESDLPKRHKRMREALMTHYGIDESHLEYYRQHMEGGDVHHSDVPDYGGDDVHVAR